MLADSWDSRRRRSRWCSTRRPPPRRSRRRPRNASAPRPRGSTTGPTRIAKSLRHRRTLTIGVMVPEISDGYAAMVMSGIEDALLQAGYLYFVASHRHRADLIEEYPRLMLDRAVDGLIARRHAAALAAAGAGRRGVRPRRHRGRHQHRARPRARGVARARPPEGARPPPHRVHQGTARSARTRRCAGRRSARRRAAHQPADRSRARRRSSKARARSPDLGYVATRAAAGGDAALHGAVRLQRHLGARRDPRDPRERACACPRTSRWSASTTSPAPPTRIPG